MGSGDGTAKGRVGSKVQHDRGLADTLEEEKRDVPLVGPERDSIVSDRQDVLIAGVGSEGAAERVIDKDADLGATCVLDSSAEAIRQSQVRQDVPLE
jgi:hypothetical protein